MNREDVEQAALIVERYCKEHYGGCECDCPLLDNEDCCMVAMEAPDFWNLAAKLRNRGLLDANS